MKQILKKFSAMLLAVLMLISAIIAAIPLEGLGLGVKAEAAGYTYDASKALSYAKNHWNDGKGLCAEFVSDCLSAGGLSSYSVSSTTLKGLLINEVGEDKFFKLVTSGNYVPISGNEGKVAAGDPIFWYCSNCGRYMHTALCNGTDSAGYLVNYAHNKANDGTKRVWVGSCYDCGKAYAGMYSMHITGSTPSTPSTPTHTIDTSYPTNFTATAKAKMDVFNADHSDAGTHYVDAGDVCTIHEVYTDGCCKVTYPTSSGTATYYCYITNFDISTLETTAPASSKHTIVVAQHADSSGKSKTFSLGSYSYWSNFDNISYDEISYVDVGADTVVVLFDNSDYSGDMWILSPGKYSFANEYIGLNDKVNSFIVYSIADFSASEYGKHKVVVTDGENADGTSKIFNLGDYRDSINFDVIQNDTISYFSVGKDTAVVLFEDDAYSGTQWLFTPGQYSLANYPSVNNNVSSFKVFTIGEYSNSEYGKHRVVVTEGEDATGASKTFCLGSYSADDGFDVIQNDTISYFSVGKDTAVVLFEDDAYSGTQWLFTPGQYSLANYPSMNNNVSSFKVFTIEEYSNSEYGKHRVVVTEGEDATGISKTFCLGSYSAGNGFDYIANDAISYISVGADTVAIVFTDAEYSGEYQVLSTGVYHLEDIIEGTYNDRISSLIALTTEEYFDSPYYDDGIPNDIIPVLTITPGNSAIDTVFSWEAIDGAISYDVIVWKDEVNADAYQWIENANSGCTVLLPTGSYVAMVIAYIDEYNGYNSDSVYFSIEKFEYTAPTPSITPGTSETTTVFSWNEVDGATGYDLVLQAGTSCESFYYDSYPGSISMLLPAGSYSASVVVYCDGASNQSEWVDFEVLENQTDPTPEPEPTTYDLTPNINGGASKLYEPWGLRYFAVYEGEDVDKVTDRGIAILKDKYYSSDMTAEEFAANANAYIFLDSAGELGYDTASGRYYATLTEGIYSYDIGAYYYVVPFAVMENGSVVYGTIKRNSMENILNTNLKLTSITKEEKAICTCILDLKESVAKHYAATGVPGASIDMVIPRGDTQNVARDIYTMEESGVVPNIVAGASRLIEPWGLRYFASYSDEEGGLSIGTRGVVILNAKYYYSSYATSPDNMRLNPNSYVYLDINGTLLYEESTGRYYATLTEGISSKDIADVYYVVPFVVLDDGSYVYGTVKQNSMMKIMKTNLNIASVPATEKQVSRDIIALYEAVKAYYE